jgi:ribosomal protein S18 acetylase RimI-like enzyme
MQIQRRLATTEDEPFVRQLFEAVREQDFAQLSQTQRAGLSDLQFRAQRAQYEASFPNAVWEILFLDGSAAGNLTYDDSAGAFHIVDVNLLPQLQGRGLGTELLQQLMEVARSQGKTVTLSVVAGNPAQRLYSRLGFRAVSEGGLHIAMCWP